MTEQEKLYKQLFDSGYECGIEDAQPKWISVKDRLPEKNGRYLCNIPILKGFQEVLDFATNLEEVDDYDFPNKNYAGFFCYDSECGFLECSEVTHWMPLPKPPKGE